MGEMLFSVVIPAHNEEKYIGKCLRSIRSAAKYVKPDEVEMIVVANRCTDQTERIARRYGARVIQNEDKCISAIRNAGVRSAKGEILVTIDSDSVMTKYALSEIRECLKSGEYIGGGTMPKFDRMSLGIFCSSMYVAMHVLPIALKNKAALSGAMFWCH